MTEDTDQVQIIDDNQFLEWLACWRNEGLTPLVIINGYTELLLKGEGGDLTDTQRRFVEIIARNCTIAADWFNLPVDYLAFRSGQHHVRWEEICLPDLITRALSDVQIDHIEVDLPDDLPPIRGNQWLQTAVLYMIEPDPFLIRTDAYQASIKADLVGDSFIQVRIGVQLDLGEGERPSLFTSTRLSIAGQIIQLLDSQLQIQALDKGTEFQFTLPVWQMPPGT